MIDKCGGEEFRDGVIVYVDTRTVNIGVIVGIEIRFGGEDAGDSDEGDDEDWVGDAGSVPLKVMLTSCNRAEGWTKDWDVDETSQSVVSLETTQQQVVVEVPIKVKGWKVRRQRRDGWVGTHTVAGEIPAND